MNFEELVLMEINSSLQRQTRIIPPGPCASSWSSGNLSYIDINDSKIIGKKYIMSKQKLQEIKDEIEEYIKNL